MYTDILQITVTVSSQQRRSQSPATDATTAAHNIPAFSEFQIFIAMGIAIRKLFAGQKTESEKDLERKLAGLRASQWVSTYLPPAQSDSSMSNMFTTSNSEDGMAATMTEITKGKHHIQLKDQQVRPLTFIKVSVNDKNVFFQGGVQEDKSGGKDVSQM